MENPSSPLNISSVQVRSPPQRYMSPTPPTSNHNAQHTDKIVRLNIGGYKYVTTNETLTRKGENFFSSLLSGRFAALKDEEGYYFIDRDGAYFAPILEWLRTGEYYVPLNMRPEAVAREALFFSIPIPILMQMKLKRSPSNIEKFEEKLQNDGFYLPHAIHEYKGVLSNAAVLYFKNEKTGCFSDAKEFTWEFKRADDLTLVTLTCNDLPYNFLFINGRLSDGSSEFVYHKPEDVQRGIYYHGYISIADTDVTAILFGESQVFLRFSKRVLVKVGAEKSSVNAGLFIPHTRRFLNSDTINVVITICKAGSWEAQESCLQILSFGDFLLVRDLKSTSLSFYVFHQAKQSSRVTLYH